MKHAYFKLAAKLDDAIDYRAMLAREQFKDRALRVESRGVVPADLVEFEIAEDQTIRELLEVLP